MVNIELPLVFYDADVFGTLCAVLCRVGRAGRYTDTLSVCVCVCVCVCADPGSQGPDVPHAALHRQQGGAHADGGGVALVRCDRGCQRVAESPR